MCKHGDARALIVVRALIVAMVLLVGCVSSTDLGLLQHAPGDGTGASMTAHLGMGGGLDKIVAVDIDLRGDVAASGNRFAYGASVLGGVPIVDRYRLLGRAGIWHSAFTSTTDRSIVPSFELAGFLPLDDHPSDPKHPERGSSERGVVVGIREDLDIVPYTTLFVGVALFFMPGY
ncbi:hypothetical protein BH11MYX1_BH11MYX1_26300 [soil metagenome]